MEEAKTEGAAAVAQAVADANSSSKAATASHELALSTANEDLEGARKSFVEWETRVEQAERALADKVKLKTHVSLG